MYLHVEQLSQKSKGNGWNLVYDKSAISTTELPSIRNVLVSKKFKCWHCLEKFNRFIYIVIKLNCWNLFTKTFSLTLMLYVPVFILKKFTHKWKWKNWQYLISVPYFPIGIIYLGTLWLHGKKISDVQNYQYQEEENFFWKNEMFPIIVDSFFSF